jgi:hypothetical protein
MKMVMISIFVVYGGFVLGAAMRETAASRRHGGRGRLSVPGAGR